MHARFAEPGSDFLAFLTLWDYLHDRQRELSGSAFRRMCRREYLHYLRVREWQDVYGQLRQAARDLGIGAGPAGTPDPRPAADRSPAAARRSAGPRGVGPHAAAGAPAARPDRARGSRPSWPTGCTCRCWPGCCRTSACRTPTQKRRRGKRRGAGRVRRRPRGPVRDLPRLRRWPGSRRSGWWRPNWSRRPGCGPGSRPRIEPEWAEPLAAHLVRRSYSEPRWDARRGAAMAAEKVTLYGLPIVAARHGQLRAGSTRRRPGTCSSRSALVEGDWQTHHKFFHRNQRLLDEAADLERQGQAARHRRRRRGPVRLLRPADTQADVTSARHFDTWWKKARAESPRPADASPPPTWSGPAAERDRPGRLPGQLGRAAAVVRVRARRAGRRGDRGHPAGRAEPGQRRGAQLAGARACARSW